MNKSKKPEQKGNLIQLIRDCIDQGNYIMTEHALQRLNERDISLNDVEYILKNGFHEKKKTCFDEVFRAWKYAMRGKTIEGVDLRVIIAFDEQDMLIITLMRIGGD